MNVFTRLGCRLWIVVQVRVCIHCTAAKQFIWLVLNFLFHKWCYCVNYGYESATYIVWMNEGCPRLPSFLAFALNSRYCGLTKPCIQVRHAQGLHNVEGEKNYKAYLNPEYLDAPLTQLGWQQVTNQIWEETHSIQALKLALNRILHY
jgi:hypothetical protein